MKQILRSLKGHITALTQTKEERRHAMVGAADLWKMKRDFQIRFLKQMDLEPDHYLLDIGCGTLRGGLPLIDYLQDSHYFGIEAREEVLVEARKELSESTLSGKNPILLHSPDISKLSIEQKFNYIWAFSVLIHMTDEILNDTLRFVSEHLSQEGVFYANVNLASRADGTWQGFPVVMRSIEFYNNACALYGLAASDLGTIEDLGHISGDETQDRQRMLRITKTGKS